MSDLTSSLTPPVPAEPLVQSPGQVALETALQTAEALAPTILGVAAVASGNPELAMAVKLAPLALQFMQSASQLANAGVLSPADLAALFAKVGVGIQTTHNAWAAMDAADATKA
jgi:hypothetical protein